MDILLPFGVLAVACLAGSILAGVKAASPEAELGGRIGLGILAAVLGIVAVALAVALYWLWRFTVEFTF